MTTIALLPGDGIGAEILDGPVAYLRQLAARRRPGRAHRAVAVRHQRLGRRPARPCPTRPSPPAATPTSSCPAPSARTPASRAEQCPNPEAALIELRHLFDLRISVRTVRVPGERRRDHRPQHHRRRVRRTGPAGRERRHRATPRTASCSTRSACRRCSTSRVEHARAHRGRRVISVDKASVYATSRLWRRIVARDRGGDRAAASTNVNVDRAAYELVKYEQLPAVIVTEGLFGDILSDVVCARAGSPALCGSATINPDRRFGARHHRPVRTGARLVAAPHRQPPLEPDRRVAGAGRPARLVPRPRRARPAHHRARRAGPRARPRRARPTTWPRPATPVLDLDEFNERVLDALAR